MNDDTEIELNKQIAQALYERDRHELGTADSPPWVNLAARDRQSYFWYAGTVYTQFVAPLAEKLAKAEAERDQARNQFLDHYNGTATHLDRIRELEEALRTRTGERDELRRMLAVTAQQADDAHETAVGLALHLDPATLED